ncbi:hypothetical protein EVJ50_00715 [Synechococcus sp. RSCCF101]|uniref:hypothetical protein n=1 Tax=Synechococcus sp. RSCCF101 TaxID=2511069 RepID=UPI001246DB69|nr:hypothetical protein [Synechococcus sp. RSCCF101]QEY30993.1 hypothetical protein EVJ50_00715 [Synechococcus sp. RSCCF101]
MTPPTSPRPARRPERWVALLSLMLSSALAVLLGVVVVQMRRQQSELGQMRQQLQQDESSEGEDSDLMSSQLRRLSRRLNELERSDSGGASSWQITRLEDRLDALENRLSRQPTRLPPPPLPSTGDLQGEEPSESEKSPDWDEGLWR